MRLAYTLAATLSLASLAHFANAGQYQPPSANWQAKSSAFADSYEEAVANKDRKILVVLGADWCHYCVMLKEHLKKANLKGYFVCLVDVEERPDLKKKHGAKSMPTSILIVNGKEESRKTGFSNAEYDAWLDDNR
jgi:thiol-disulfide isomerase/thioredoxin